MCSIGAGPLSIGVNRQARTARQSSILIPRRHNRIVCSIDGDYPAPSCTKPLAFVSNQTTANPRELMGNRKLKELSLTPAERCARHQPPRI